MLESSTKFLDNISAIILIINKAYGIVNSIWKFRFVSIDYEQQVNWISLIAKEMEEAGILENIAWTNFY